MIAVERLMNAKRMKLTINTLLILLAIMATSTYVYGEEFSVLDDVTMQVIEMEQLPDDVIKLIPLPNHMHNNMPHMQGSAVLNNTKGFNNMLDPNIDPLMNMPHDPTMVDPTMVDPTMVNPTMVDPLPDGSIGLDPNTVDPVSGLDNPSLPDPGILPPNLPPDPVMEPPQLPPDIMPPNIENLPPDPVAPPLP